MNKKFLKIVSLVGIISTLGINMAFAEENVDKSSNDDISLMSGTVFWVNGGHGEWGYGWRNMWGKYWHTTKDHRVVLQKDNSHVFGAWEAGGPTASYRETSKGSNMNATGQIR